jgi:hypothetical protein
MGNSKSIQVSSRINRAYGNHSKNKKWRSNIGMRISMDLAKRLYFFIFSALRFFFLIFEYNTRTMKTVEITFIISMHVWGKSIIKFHSLSICQHLNKLQYLSMSFFLSSYFYITICFLWLFEWLSMAKAKSMARLKINETINLI